jgi:hypothetical protein
MMTGYWIGVRAGNMFDAGLSVASANFATARLPRSAVSSQGIGSSITPRASG